jgi:Ran GTPase-activating protein (RanGAP) involved in mRNA processing and transport
MLPSQSSPSFNQSIVALRLAGNGLTDSGVAALALVIQRGRRSLSSALETNDDVDDAINCSDSPSSEQHAAAPLRLLNLSYNSIGINGARALARCLGSNDSDFPDSICMLRALNVAGCRLDDASAEVLSQAIGAQLTNLQFDDSISVKIGLRVLNISDNLFTPVGLSTLSQQVRFSPSIGTLFNGLIHADT